MSRRKFKELHADGQLRKLLGSCCIPVHIPSSLDKLAQFAAAQGWRDGPQALAKIRNAFVHPKPKHRKAILQETVGIRRQAWKLGLWYTELVLLWLFGYAGEYSNRLSKARFKGAEVEPVPWA